MSEQLDGRFFWEHTVTDETTTSKNVLDIRRGQKKFASNATSIMSNNKIPHIERKIEAQQQKILFKKEQEFLKPVINAVASAHNISVIDLLGKSTSPLFTKAKQHFYWAMFKYNPSLSAREAGIILGKCRTTIRHGCLMFNKRQDFAKVVEVEKLLGLL